ncbi:Uncharacterised protein [uncultured archaeon]|nr:Uncharacterised protein [uncultured archaeon]
MTINIDEYTQEFEDMFIRITEKGEKPYRVFSEYSPAFEEEGIGIRGMSHHFFDFVKDRVYRTLV